LLIENLHNEALLVQEMQAGSESAFTTLYKYYSPRLYINILSIVHDPLLAEEIVQDLFTRIWQKRESKGIKENFAGYMFRIGQNLVHDFFRKVQRDRKLMQKFRLLVEEQYEEIDETFSHQQSSAILGKAIEQLSPQQKRVYQLVKIEGHTYKRAAEIMGISIHTVKEYLVTTKKSIHNYILHHMDGNFELLFLLIIYCSLS
jgi:RNA polymerase sigma factor (sigma-70 family)